MTAQITFNPMITTTGLGGFNITSDGYIQGQAMDSPNARFNLAGGILGADETLPMWGGVGISAYTTPSTVTLPPNQSLGSRIKRALNLTAADAGELVGFSVFDQDYAMVNTPQSPVPLAAPGMQVNYYRLGSGARIVVACDPSLVSLEDHIITQHVSWDFNNQVLQPYDAATATVTITTYTWAAGVATVVAAAASTVGGIGDVVNISGATNSGTGGAAAVNGNFVVNGFTDNQHFTLAMPAAAGVITSPMGGSPVLNEGTGALAVKVLDVQIGNSMTVVYDPVTGFATWNRSGSAALILI